MARLSDEQFQQALQMAQEPDQFGAGDLFKDLGRQRLVEAGATQQQADAAVNEPGSTARLRRMFPSLTASGTNFAEEAVLGGKVDFQDLMDNTEKELKSLHGRDNVRVRTEGSTGAKVEFETRDGPDAEWTPIGAKKALRGMLKKRDDAFAAKIDVSRGAPLKTRAKLGFRDKPGGKANLLLEDFGPGNVYLFSTGQHAGKFAVNLEPDTDDGDWVLTDEEGTSFADLADIAGPATRVVPGAIGSILGGVIGSRAGRPVAGSAVGGAAGDILGEAAFAGIGERVGGESLVGPQEHATNIALGVGSGLAGEGIGAAAGAAKRAFGPTGAVGRGVARELVPTTLRESISGGAPRGAQVAAGRKALGEEFGIDLSAAQLTQGAKAAKFEDLIRAVPGGEEVFRLFDVKQSRQLAKAVDNVLDGVSRESVGSAAATKQAGKAFETFANKLIEKRAAKIRPLFLKAERAGARVEPTKTLEVLAEEIEATKGRLSQGASTSKILGKGLEDLRDRFFEPIVDESGNQIGQRLKPWTMTELQNDLSEIGRLAGGTGDLFKDLDKASGSRVSKRLFGAMIEDLDAAEGGAALQKARRTYRNMSVAIDAVRENFLQRAVKLSGEDTPELFVERFLTPSVTPRRIKKVIGLLNKADPGAAGDMQRAVLEQALLKAEPPTNSVLARAIQEGEPGLGPAQLASVMLNPKNAEKLRALLPGKAFSDLQKISKLAQAASATGAVGSQTAGRLFTGEFWRAVLGSVTSPRTAAKELGAMANAKMFAIAMVSPEGRDVFLKLAKPAPNMTARGAARLMAKLSDIVLRGQDPAVGGTTGLGGKVSQPAEARTLEPVPGPGAASPSFPGGLKGL